MPQESEVFVVSKTKEATGYSSWTWWMTTVGSMEARIDGVTDLETKVHLTSSELTVEVGENPFTNPDRH
jgi:hypothetical protein